MMTLQNIAQTITTSKRVTPELEKQLNSLLWSKELDPAEQRVLKQLLAVLESGMVTIESERCYY